MWKRQRYWVMWVTGGTLFQAGWAAKMRRPQGRSGALTAFQKPAGAQSRVSGDESRGTVGQGYTGHRRDFGFYSEWNGKPLYGFEMKNDTIGLSFLKNQSACCVDNRLEVVWRWKQKRVVRKQLRWPTCKMASDWTYMPDDSRLNLAAAEAEKSQQILDLFCREHH